MMMMNTSCIAGCLDDALPQEEGRYVKLYKGAESDKEFLRILSMNTKPPPPPPSPPPPHYHPSPRERKWAHQILTTLMRILTMNTEPPPSPPSPPPPPYHPSPTKKSGPSDFQKYETYASSRQKYLRSYPFSKKEETAAQRAEKWLKKKTSFMGKNVKNDESAARGSCCLMDGCLKVLLLCVAKVDVHED